jgi:PAS domain S-box-containing protein
MIKFLKNFLKIKESDDWSRDIAYFVIRGTAVIVPIINIVEITFINKKIMQGNFFSLIYILFLVYVLFHIRKYKSHSNITSLCLFLGLLLITYRSYFSGGLVSPFLAFLPILPIMGFFILPIKNTIILMSSIILSLVFLAFYHDPSVSYLAPSHFAINIIGSLTVITFFGYVFSNRTKSFQRTIIKDIKIQETLFRTTQTALAGANLGSWEFNIKTNKTEFDDRWAEIIGFKHGELANLDFSIFIGMIHPDDAKRVDKYVAAYLKQSGDEKFECRYRLKHRQGHWVYVLSRGEVLERDDEGKPQLFLGTHLDITELEESKAIISKSKDQMVQLIKLIPAAVAMFDKNFNYLGQSAEWEKFYQITDKDITMKNHLELVPNWPQEMVNSCYEALLGESIKKDEQLYIIDGKKSWISYSVKPWLNLDESIGGSIVMVEEVTEKVDSELRMNQSARMSALGEMAGGIAHEINNPLSIISGFANIVKREIQAENIVKSMEYLNKIDMTIMRISKIVHGMINFSRDGSKDDILVESVDSLIADTLDLCTEKLKNNNIKLRLDVEEGLFVKCRFVEVAQVLINLLINGFHAIEELESKWLKLQVFSYDEVIHFNIIDAGSGIPEDVVLRLFDPFFTTKKVGQGTGLGLSIAKGIIESHDGTLTYDNEAKNTTFTIILPKGCKDEHSQ